jgi:lipopolysaccharide export system permease protein
MTRLAAYLVRLFSIDALALFGVASLLLFLAQCLRAFDVVTVKGQDFLTLIGQSMLTMPTLAIAFAHVCLGIGLARGLRALQMSQELHIIHSSRRIRALFGAIASFTGIGLLLVLLLAHIFEPMTRRHFNAWSASIAADLVSRTLTPNRFVEVTPGVTLVIGARGTGGEIGRFFADDRRSAGMRRTYIAESATVASDKDGYVLQLHDGAIQYMTSDYQFSEISFARYDLAVDRLAAPTDAGTGTDGKTTIQLVAEILESGRLSSDIEFQIGERTSQGFRVLALCLLVAAIAAFPSGNRGGTEVPIEVVVLGAAFLERAVTANYSFNAPLLPPSGTVLLAAFAVVVLALRMRKIGPVRLGRALA